MSLRSFFPGLVGLLAVGLCAPGWAQTPSPMVAPAVTPPMAVWGVYRCGVGTEAAPASCEPLPEVHRALEKKLQSLAYKLGPLSAEGAAGLPACAPAQCAQELQSACAGGSGRVVGALLQPHQSLTQVRLWMYDLGTQQLAVQDDYCQSCDLSSAVVGQIGTLLDSPSFGPPPAALPAYCGASSAVGASAPARSSGRVALLVLGEGHHKAVAREALKDHLRVLGRRPQLGQGDRRQLGIADLHKLLAGDRRGQVLVVELTAQATELSLFDAATELTQTQSFPCEGCDKEQFAGKLKSAAGTLLDHCFGEGCATATVQTPAPPGACLPFVEPPRPFAAPGGPSPIAYQLDPKLARATKGALWGLFGVSAATAVALFALNGTSAGTVSINGAQSSNELVRPAYAATGFAALSLGVSIPITILLNRAQAKNGPASKQSTSRFSSLSCPK